MLQLQEAWKQLEGAVSTDQNISAMRLAAYLFFAGFLSLYLRLLYRKCSASASDTESFSRIFPLLAVITTAVIAVVKSSLALSLGLVGALSIVRFRAAIKDPEELVYLFLCIAVGLSLGAELPLLAIALVAVATIFIVIMHLSSSGLRRHRLMLTITGDSDRYFSNDDSEVLSSVQAIAGKYTLQRYDIEDGRGQVRILLRESNPETTAKIVAELRKKLPDCDLSYVNLNSTL